MFFYEASANNMVQNGSSPIFAQSMPYWLDNSYNILLLSLFYGHGQLEFGLHGALF
jgi:hypothetical protein